MPTRLQPGGENVPAHEAYYEDAKLTITRERVQVGEDSFSLKDIAGVGYAPPAGRAFETNGPGTGSLFEALHSALGLFVALLVVSDFLSSFASLFVSTGWLSIVGHMSLFFISEALLPLFILGLYLLLTYLRAKGLSNEIVFVVIPENRVYARCVPYQARSIEAARAIISDVRSAMSAAGERPPAHFVARAIE